MTAAAYRPGKFRAGVVVSVGGYTYTADGPEVPEEHARLMPNPKLWERAPQFVEPAGDSSTSSTAGDSSTLSTAGDSSTSSTAGEPAPEPPPLGGPEGSTANWEAYAALVGVSTDGMTKRSEIIDALAAAGKPTGRE